MSVNLSVIAYCNCFNSEFRSLNLRLQHPLTSSATLRAARIPEDLESYFFFAKAPRTVGEKTNNEIQRDIIIIDYL